MEDLKTRHEKLVKERDDLLTRCRVLSKLSMETTIKLANINAELARTEEQLNALEREKPLEEVTE